MRASTSLVVPLVALALAGAQPASAQTETPPDPVVLSMAAGYKALTVCSAVFNARANGVERSLESIQSHELDGVYPELNDLVREMPVVLGDHDASVAWDAALPPRRAVYASGRGCAILPVGMQTPPARAPETRAPSPTPLATAAPSGDAAALNAAVQRAFSSAYGSGARTTGVVVLQNGRIVAEHYAEGFGPDTPQRTWSVGKSLAGAVVGAAVHRGLADVNAPAAIADWSTPGDPRAAITLDNLLRMASGLTSDTAGNRTDALYFGGVGIDEQAPTWPLIAPPGARYRYANNDTLLAVLSLQPTFADFSPNALFDQLGMIHTVAETDWRGGYIMSSQVWATARDLARFGQLYVQDGVWEGRRILPEGWRDYVSQPSGPQPPTGAFGYGATVWLMNRSPGVPADTFAAFGNRGQYVVIAADRQVVIVRRGEDPAGHAFDIAALSADVLSALD